MYIFYLEINNYLFNLIICFFDMFMINFCSYHYYNFYLKNILKLT